MKLIKKTIILLMVVLCLSFNVFADTYEDNYSVITYNNAFSEANLQVVQLRYEPYPANPGDYVTVWIKAENIGNTFTKDAVFKLIPEYPFSLDSSQDAIKSFGNLNTEPVVLEYKLKVDENAVDGINEIKIAFLEDGQEDNWGYKTFDIEVDNSQTDFDLVIQEISGNELSIAIANTGKNVAYSTIVRIPNQENFNVIGTDGQMVGNLEDGDYTLVGFEVNNNNRNSLLNVQIDYTDEIGERRSVVKEVKYPLTLTSSSELNLINGRPTKQQQETSLLQKWWFWLLIVFVAFLTYRIYKRYKIFRSKRGK